MTGQSPAAGGPRIFYGWIVVAAAFSVMLIGFGIAYSFGAFFVVLQEDFGASRGDTAFAFSLAGALYFGLGAVSGPLADRFGTRWIAAAGMLVIALGLAAASQASNLWQLYASYGVAVGLGVGLSYVPAIGAVQPWFRQRRGFASGLAVSGIGVGTLAMPPLAAELIDAFGWRGAYLALALLSGLVGTAVALLLERDPARRGLAPDGVAPAAAATPAAAPPDASFTLRQAVATLPFWLLYLSGAAASFALFIPFVHLPAYAQDHGLSEQVGVWLIGIIGIGSILGRFAVGGVADRWGRRRGLLAMFVGLSAMMLWWLAASSVWALAVFALLFGTFYGGFVALVPALTTDYYGGRYASSIIGLLYTSVAAGTLVGPTLAGMAYDLVQSYTVPILASALCNLGSVFAMMVLAEPERWRAARLPALRAGSAAG